MTSPKHNVRETFHRASEKVHVQYAKEGDKHGPMEIQVEDLLIIDESMIVASFAEDEKKLAISYAEGYANGKQNSI